MHSPIFLLIFGIFALLNFIAKKISEGTQGDSQNPGAPPSSSPYRPLTDTETEQERLRKFRKALGLPEEEQPPAPVIPKPPVPRSIPPAEFPRVRPAAAFPPVWQPPPSAGKPPGRILPPASVPLPPSPPPAVRPAAQPSPIATVAVPEAYGLTSASQVQADSLLSPATLASAGIPIDAAPLPPASPRLTGLRSLLATPASIQNTILLREILGPPGGLQSSL